MAKLQSAESDSSLASPAPVGEVASALDAETAGGLLHELADDPWHLKTRGWAITLAYALVAILWIYFSDRALILLAPDQETFTRWSVYKGAAFVLVTTCLLFFLVRRAFRALDAAYRALRVMNNSLEAKVIERTQALEAAVLRAESADRLKSAFLATMSHELRTPLNSIIGFTGILLQGLAGPLNPEQGKQLGMVRSSAQHLLELINDVLDLSKIEAGQLQIKAENFNLRAAIERVIDSLEPAISKKGLQLEHHIDPALSSMHSDRRRVEQILLNLLNNAVKFTDKGGIALAVSLLAEHPSVASKGGVVCISIRDTGLGIKDEDMAALFRPFSQVDSGLARQHEGTGLGLAICRRLAHLLGGEIQARSEWGKGSEFTVVLPLEYRV